MNLIYSKSHALFKWNRTGLKTQLKTCSFLALMLFGLSFSSFAESPIKSTLASNVDVATITGIVTDADGESLIGVSILKKGMSSGTITDIDGSYSINAEPGTVLIFSYTGYKSQEVVIGASTVIDVTLASDTELLDEIVVIGYGTIKKSNLTGAVSSIKGSELKSIVTGNATSALQGKVSGLQIENNGGEPGGAANVFIRGVSSLTNSFPLYVIDGTFASDLSFINPKDIDRIEVLKDAAASAIYGNRAANGVVIVSTKRGTAGGAPRVSLDVRGGFETPDNELDFLNGQEFLTYRRQREANDNTGFEFAPGLPNLTADTDWQDLSLNSGSIQDYGLSVSGGGENSRYFISGNYYEQDGILVSTGYERYNLRANSEFTLGKFKVQQSISLTRSERERNNFFGRDGSSSAPILRENVPENDGGFEAPNFDDFGFAGLNKFGLATLEENLESDNQVFGNLNLSYEIVEGLVAKVNLGADLLLRNNFSFRPTFFMSSSDPIDNVNELNDLTEIRSERLLTLVEPTLSYGRDVGAGRFDAVVGLTRQQIDDSSVGVYAQGLPNNDIRVIGAANPANVNATIGANVVSGLISQFGRINYSHDNKYLISGTLRRDESSRFAEDFRVGYFPSVSAGWNISNEPFWGSKTVNKFKLRAGYGELGSQSIPDYAFQSVFNLTSSTSVGNTIEPGFAQTSLAIPNLQWETAKTFNIGADVGLWQDKLIVSAEYYVKNVEDVLVAVNLPSSVGFSEPVVQNVGEIRNSGFELEGLYRLSAGKLNLNIGLNFSVLNSEIQSLPNAVVGPTVTEDGVIVNRFEEGEAPGFYFGFEIDGIYNNQGEIDAALSGDPVRAAEVQPGDFRRRDLNGDGLINGDDQTNLGDPTPDFTYGLSLSGDIANFDFGLFFQGVQGNEIYNVTKFYNIFWADDNKLSEISNAWTPTNTNTNIPRTTTSDAGGNGAPSSFFVEDGSYLRLKTLELGYTLPTTNVSWLRDMRVFVTVQNLFTITDYSGYNPDISSTNGGRASTSPFFGVPSDVNPLLGRGLDLRAYPNARSFVLGIQAGF